MKKILLVLATPMLLWGELRAQCLTNGNFDFTSCPVTHSPDGCPTWSGSCNGWMISHGTPDIDTTRLGDVKQGTITTVFMWGAATQGEGMFTAYTFQANQAYDVRIYFASTCTTTGHVNIFAMNGMTAHALTGCGNGYPSPAGGQLIGQYNGNTGGAIADVTYTFTANANYSQLWIYPDGAGSEGPSEYMMTFFSVDVCPSCTNLVVYNTGNVPTGANAAGNFRVGTGTPTLPGFVGISSGVSTVLTARQEIDLVQNFTATATGAGSFVAQISPCDPVNSVQGTSSELDSAVILNPAQFESAKTGATDGQGSAFNDAAATKLQVYPTISAGAFTITGSAADLGNTNILVTDESGRPVYRLHNDAATTVNLDLSKFGNGIYFLQISNKTKAITQKIVIQK